jgi:hypothetical protein
MYPHYTSQHRLRTSSLLYRWPGDRLRPVLAGLCLLGLTLWAPVGLAPAHVPSSRPYPLAENLTQDLITLSTHYHLADPAARAQFLSTLRTLATERHQLLAALLEGNPGEVLRVALPADLRAGLPAAVQALVEEEMEVEGELEVLHEDRDVGSRYVYFLKTTRGRFALHFAAERLHLVGPRVCRW